MRKLTLILIIIYGFAHCSCGLQSFEPTNVIINLKRTLQPDSIGYNLPLELPRLIYSRILNGSITLWDSPLKEIKISAEALASIEKSSGTSFTMVENLFIHEIWELSKRYLDTKTIGFTFLSKNEKGAVSYGFVEYKDLLFLLDKNNIPCNANGYLNTTYREAVQNKQFNFSIIQFGNEDFSSNPVKAFDIQKELFNNSKIKLYNLPKEIPRYKTVCYEISNDENGNENNRALFSAISGYFQKNLEQFYNLGGDQNIPFLKKNPVIYLTKIKVTELYRYDRGKVSSEITTIQLLIYGKYLPVSDIESFRQIGITVNFKPLESFIGEKKYVFNLTSINSEEINTRDSMILINKIELGNWKRLVEH